MPGSHRVKDREIMGEGREREMKDGVRKMETVQNYASGGVY